MVNAPISWGNVKVEYICPNNNVSYTVPLGKSVIVRGNMAWDDEGIPSVSSSLLIPNCACSEAHEITLL